MKDCSLRWNTTTSTCRRWQKKTLGVVAFCLTLLTFETHMAAGFIPSTRSIADLQPHSGVYGKDRRQNSASRPPLSSSFPPNGPYNQRRLSTELYSFMGSDGGILGIGTPELLTILLVGYFVLGPSDLYKLTKEIGKFVQNFRTFTTEATATLENNMENQLQLEEIRKAQRELTDAFSFRRSINVDEDTDPFEVNAQSPRPMVEEEVAGGAAAAATTSTKKKRVRRVKKKAEANDGENRYGVSDASELANNVPDLDFDDDDLSDAADKAIESMQAARDELAKEQKAAAAKDAAALTRQERKERLQRAQEISSANGEATAAEQSRFQQQLSGDWNSQILANNEKLDPLAGIMERLAVLEEEKIAADKRLQEEFRLREENEEKYYREKRQLLEEAAAKVQASAYASTMSSSTSATGSESKNL